MSQKVVIFSAPSGAGKSTIVGHILKKFNCFEFSVSATSRAPRGKEKNGREYYFISEKEFRNHIKVGDFVEWQQVYKGSFYGTLKSEVERIWSEGKVIIFDVDVKGGYNLKKYFGDKALSVFIQPPSIGTLYKRLVLRRTDSTDAIAARIAKADEEIKFAKGKFDCTIVNDDLQKAFQDIDNKIGSFL